MGTFRQRAPLDESLSFRFVFPVAAELTFTTLIGLLISQVVSGISPSALAAIGLSNSIMTVVTVLFSAVTIGTSILVSRQVGEGDWDGMVETVEQSTFLTLLSTLTVTLLCLLFADPLLRLFMPSAEEQMLFEATRYFQVMMGSLPFLILQNVYSGIYRGMGDSRLPLVSTVVMNLIQLLFSWLCINQWGWNELGAGAALIFCRIGGLGIIVIALLREHHRLPIRVGRILRPRLEACKRIIRIGLPVSFESTFVQGGYLIANSMAIALGGFESGVYQIINTVNGFTGIAQSICATIILSAVGHLLGRKEYSNIRKAGWQVMIAGLLAGLFLGTLAVVFREPIAGFYSSDPATVRASAELFWVLLLMNGTGLVVNVFDSQLRAGGDVTYVMVNSSVGVWLVRLPLTYLFCFVWGWGVPGIFAANIISLAGRAVAGLVRYCGNKWMYQRV